MINVLCTRPSPYNDPLKDILTEHGYTVWDEPLLLIEAAYNPRPIITDPYLILTSQTALDQLEDRRLLVADLFERPCYCVGHTTAKAARAFGFVHVEDADGDGLALSRLLLQQPIRPVLHITGSEIAVEPQHSLKVAGWEVHFWPVYQTRPAPRFSDRLIKAFHNNLIDVVLLFSTRTAENFVSLIRQLRLESCCHSIIAIGLSEDIRQVLVPLSFSHIEIASVPRQAEMLEVLYRHCPVQTRCL